jgi:hypothetical protein
MIASSRASDSSRGAEGWAGRLVIVGLILLPAPLLGCENSQRAQAQALLERIAALDPNAARAERTRGIERLRALPLSAAALVRVRDRCALAHGGLFEAEEEQAAVRERLDAAAGRGSPAAKTELEGIAALVAHARQTLAEARAALPECERSTRALAVRYR